MKTAIQLWPNPAHTSIHIIGLSGRSIVELTTLQGQKITQTQTEDREIEIPTIELENGIYQLKIFQNNQVHTESSHTALILLTAAWLQRMCKQ